MAEATNEVAFIATGAYGHPMSKQHGAPLRLAVPWKYGFKSIKSIVRFSFVEQRPKAIGKPLRNSEYGFWANVDPAVPHPRWSQASEEVIGTGERRPTLFVQRLWRLRRRHLQGPGKRTPVGVIALPPASSNSYLARNANHHDLEGFLRCIFRFVRRGLITALSVLSGESRRKSRTSSSNARPCSSWLTPNDKLATYGLDDPEVEGVACHFTVPRARRPEGLDRRGGGSLRHLAGLPADRADQNQGKVRARRRCIP